MKPFVKKSIAAWGETDVLVSGFDPTIGQVSEISQSIVDQLRDANVEEINYIQADAFSIGRYLRR